MAQLNLYVSDDLAETLRREAKAAGKSISSLVAERLLDKQVVDAQQHWDQVFADLAQMPEGDIEEPLDPPAEPLDVSLDEIPS